MRGCDDPVESLENKPQTKEDKRATFLEALRNTCNVAHSARVAGISRKTAYEWKKAEPQFAAKVADAIQDGVSELERNAHERALSGSDLLTIFLLKAHRPEKYRDNRQVDVSHTGNITVTIIDDPLPDTPPPAPSGPSEDPA